MDQPPDWLPEAIVPKKPSVARIYDYLLGGAHNLRVDREFARTLRNVDPGAQPLALANRMFLFHATRHMLDSGIHQFLDLGSGIPTVGSVHEIAQCANPSSRVVYVDYEPVAIAHAELLLENNDQVTVVHADTAHPDAVLDAPETQRMLDFDAPIGILALAMFHYLGPEQEPTWVVSRYRDAVAPGSQLALTHLTDEVMNESTSRTVDLMKQTQDHIHPRARTEVLGFFDGFELIEPGLTTVTRWLPDRDTHPEAAPHARRLLAGIARKPQAPAGGPSGSVQHSVAHRYPA